MNFLKQFLTDPLSWFLGYVFAAIVTFGHAYNNGPQGYYSSWSPTTYIHYGVFEKTVSSMFSAGGWPLYVSVQLQKKEEK